MFMAVTSAKLLWIQPKPAGRTPPAGSILTVTSYATRTSPVIRGNWILGNLLGIHHPAASQCAQFEENTISASLPMRERLAQHRANAACASCHNLMDPIGFSLENFDAIGRWRTTEDVCSRYLRRLAGWEQIHRNSGLEAGLCKHPELFVGTLTEKLMMFALGAGLNLIDAPAVRKIIQQAQLKNYRFSSVILGIVNSTPFTMRKSP